MCDHSCHDGSLHRKQEQEAHIIYFQLLGVQIQPREGDNGRWVFCIRGWWWRRWLECH